MGAHVLPGEHRRSSRHAHRVLVVRPAVVDALGGEPVRDRRAGDLPAVAAERVVALLAGRDEEDVAAHRRSPPQACVSKPAAGAHAMSTVRARPASRCSWALPYSSVEIMSRNAWRLG